MTGPPTNNLTSQPNSSSSSSTIPPRIKLKLRLKLPTDPNHQLKRKRHRESKRANKKPNKRHGPEPLSNDATTSDDQEKVATKIKEEPLLKSKKSLKSSKQQTQKPQSAQEVVLKKRGRPPKNKKLLARQPVRVWEAAKKDLKSVGSRLLESLIKKDAYGFFLTPVDMGVIPDYALVIRHPMDFTTMKERLERDYYQHLDDILHDFKMIVRNAKTYNAPNTIYWRSADRLEMYGEKAFERAAAVIVYEEKEDVDGDETLQIVEEQEDEELVVVDKESLANSPQRDSRMGSISMYSSSMEQQMDFVMSNPPVLATKKKKKKKKVADTCIYGPDGSLQSASGAGLVSDLLALSSPLAFDPPRLSTISPQSLPSAFYNRTLCSEDSADSKSSSRPAVFTDYGPLATLGEQTPGGFYTAQDAFYIYPLYGDDRGEAYMRSMWDFVETMDELKEQTEEKARFLTRGAWDVVRQVLLGDAHVRHGRGEPAGCVETEFGTVDVPSILPTITLAGDLSSIISMDTS
ncbi:hypothetical protein J3Q64DRAFT_1722561 [Phycomyces blakesleeanus]|uniref:Bromo domain-containing protein n=2 Tax=Phycomyces blakesleeanus TaxID=4837 RepID=A0ABR3BAN9_PHYBL